MKNRFFSYIYVALLILSDILVLFLSLKLSYFIRENSFHGFLPEFNEFGVDKYFWILLLILLFLIFEKVYIIRYDFWTELKKLLKVLFFSFITVFTIISITKISDDYSRTFLIFFFISLIFFLPIFKRITKRVLFSFKIFKIKVKIVTNSSQQQKLLTEEFINNWYLGYEICDSKYQKVIISSKKFLVDDLQKLIKRYSKITKDIYVIPYMYHLDFSHANVVDYFNIRLSTIHIENRLLSIKNIFIKYFFEKVLVVFVLPFALILHLFLSIVIKLDSKGSIFFKQKRLGKTKNFTCYKYRTMYENGDEILKDYLLKNVEEVEYYEKYHKYKNDPRITKVGKVLRATSLDEFPQFFNVLRGDMNLIGPRPYMLIEKQKIGKDNEDIILRVKPGITGLWQVSGRNNLTFNERVELDKWYIQNWSLWMDFVIFMKTIKVVFAKIGAK